jgi:hypothetical protein
VYLEEPLHPVRRAYLLWWRRALFVREYSSRRIAVEQASMQFFTEKQPLMSDGNTPTAADGLLMPTLVLQLALPGFQRSLVRR